MLGSIVYLYLLDLENNLAIRQELIKDRFCKVIEEKVVKGGSENEQYMQYKLESIFTGKIYLTNNYLSPYNFCDLKTLEETIERLSSLMEDNKLESIKQLIDEVKA